MTSGIRGKKEKLFFAPGCALMIYKPGLAKNIHRLLIENLGEIDMLMACCQHKPDLPENSRVINVCPGCDKRYAKEFKGVTTISLWELINENSFLKYPDYNGKSMTIIDACPTRDEERVQNAIRELLIKMNIRLVEPKNTRRESTCCGDFYYGSMPASRVKELMIEKAQEMPADDIVVHCVSCIVAVSNGHRKPQYMADLLMNEETSIKSFDLDEWHKELSKFIDTH
jgi:Cysteine-rich domain